MVEKAMSKNYLSELKEINESLKNISKIVDTLPESSWKESIETSVRNFDKKMAGFLASEMSPERKTLLNAIRTGKLTEEQISQISAAMEKSTGNDDEKQAAPTKVKGKK